MSDIEAQEKKLKRELEAYREESRETIKNERAESNARYYLIIGLLLILLFFVGYPQVEKIIDKVLNRITWTVPKEYQQTSKDGRFIVIPAEDMQFSKSGKWYFIPMKKIKEEGE
jgi:hypothetical protein